MSDLDGLLLTEKDVVPYLKSKYPHMYRGNDEAWCRMRESALLLLLKSYDVELLLDAQLAKVKQYKANCFRRALEQSRKGEPLELSEEDFELFSAIQNDGIAKACQTVKEGK